LGINLLHLRVESKDRENFITDDINDGGIDAYFIDNQNRKIFFVQSKFRSNEKNFHEKEIVLTELLLATRQF
jgi:hypothetical protein